MAEVTGGHVLASSEIFSELDAEVLCQLEQLGRRRSYRARETLFQKGDASDFLVAILSGCVRVCVYSVEGREIVLNIIEPGQVVGEIGMLDNKGRTADAVAIDAVEALVIDRGAVKRVLAENPEATFKLIETLCTRLRRTSNQVEIIGYRDLPARMAALLLELKADFGRETGSGILIDRKLSQRDMARMIASTRESVNRQLRTWTADGVISIEDGLIEIRDLDLLEEMAL